MTPPDERHPAQLAFTDHTGDPLPDLEHLEEVIAEYVGAADYRLGLLIGADRDVVDAWYAKTTTERRRLLVAQLRLDIDLCKERATKKAARSLVLRLQGLDAFTDLFDDEGST